MTINLTCTICSQSIADLYYLTVGSQFSIHLECLQCSVCSCKLEMQTKCYLNNGRFYCLDDYLSMTRNTTRSESLQSNESYSDLTFSKNPNSTTTTTTPITNPSASTYCRTCTQLIDSDEYVIRISRTTSALPLYDLYHPQCFRCVECRELISPGDKYGILGTEHNVFCGQHYLTKQAAATSTDASNKDYTSSSANHGSIASTNSTHLDHNNNTNSFQTTTTAATSNSTSSSSSSSSTSPLSLNSSPKSTNSTAGKLGINKAPKNESNSLPVRETLTASGGGGPLTHNLSQSILNSISIANKKKRMRTSFKHQQLRIMKAHFLTNQNPDSKELKELSERTGLQKRVLQNSRAKQRKSSTNPNGGDSMTLNYSSSSSVDYHYASGSAAGVNGGHHRGRSKQQTNDESMDDEADREDEVNELLEIEDNFDLEDDDEDAAGDEDSHSQGSGSGSRNMCETAKFTNENYNSGSSSYGNVVQHHQSTLINFYSCY